MVTLTLYPLKFGEFSGFFPKKPFVEVVVLNFFGLPSGKISPKKPI